MNDSQNFSVNAHEEDGSAPGVDELPSAPAHATGQVLDEHASRRATDVLAARRRRIDELRGAALMKVDPLLAALSGLAADLVEIGLDVGDATRRALGEGPVTAEAIRENGVGVNFLLRVGKQVAQLTRLEQDIESSNQDERPASSRARPK